MQVSTSTVEEWIRRGHADLWSATLLLRAGYVQEALFHCQQAAEKALKAFLASKRQPFPRIHDLAELGLLCSAFDPSLEELLAQALGLAAQVVTEIERRLPPPCTS